MKRTDDTEPQKPVTMRTVAELAGVSMATVSRVLNDSSSVDPQMAERVRAVIVKLKYQPNSAARALASSRSAFVGLMLPDLENPFFIELMRGIEEEVRVNKYLLVVCNYSPDPGIKEQSQYTEILVAAPIAGAVIIPMPERLTELDLLKARNVPIVAVDQPIRDPSIDSVRINNVVAAKEAVAHLIANGYRRIGVISGPRLLPTADERVLGYRQALQEAGIEYDPVLEHRGPFIEETGRRATSYILDLDSPADAIFATNNRLATGALRTLYLRRKRVPDDIAFVGFDLIHWAVPDTFSITTVLQPTYEIGRAAANRLLQRIRQPDTPRQEIILPHTLLINESSRPRKQRGLIEPTPSEQKGQDH